VPWAKARRTTYDLVVAASPKGDLRLLSGTRVLVPHGAGFNKSIGDEGSADSASGLDPAYLAPEGRPFAALHALAHPAQVERLRAASPLAAAGATVVGDPTLERLLASLGSRDRYRAALGTGTRRLIALASTWGKESLLEQRPGLVTELTLRLPHDDYQVALITHPNVRARFGELELAQRLGPALDAGLVLAGPYEEWAAVLVACDAVVSDHGSTALYAAALDRPVLNAYDGGGELLPGTPMAELLAHAARFSGPESLGPALDAYRPGTARAAADLAFAEEGRALDRLRAELYALLGLDEPALRPEPAVLPSPAGPVRTPAAFAVRVTVDGDRVTVERHPAATDLPAHHLAAEYATATERQSQSAALLYHRPQAPAVLAASGPQQLRWTAGGWTAHVLESYPGCRTAAVIHEDGTALLRTRGGRPLTLTVPRAAVGGQAVRIDPAAALSAVHAWLGVRGGRVPPPGSPVCVVGGVAVPLSLSPATAEESARLI
jgi:hypothetical protein